MMQAVKLYIDKCNIDMTSDKFIFVANHDEPITRMQAYRIIKEGGKRIGINISCHSLRKTFGYHAWKKGIPPVMLMQIFNHSTFEITKRYLGIEQDDKDSVFKSVEL
jgi:integrase